MFFLFLRIRKGLFKKERTSLKNQFFVSQKFLIDTNPQNVVSRASRRRVKSWASRSSKSPSLDALAYVEVPSCSMTTFLTRKWLLGVEIVPTMLLLFSSINKFLLVIRNVSKGKFFENPCFSLYK
jgi:hypothetical protein